MANAQPEQPSTSGPTGSAVSPWTYPTFDANALFQLLAQAQSGQVSMPQYTQSFYNMLRPTAAQGQPTSSLFGGNQNGIL